MKTRTAVGLVALFSSFAIACGASGPDPSSDDTQSAAEESATQSDGSLVLFGGANNSETRLADTWTWNGENWTQRTVVGPSARTEAIIAPFRGAAFLFGGDSSFTPLGDFWMWNGSKWTEEKTKGGPGPLASAPAANCNGNWVLFGGYDNNGNTRYDTWSWNGTHWTVLRALGPGHKGYEGPTSSDDATATLNGKCYFFGAGFGLGNDSWTWTGEKWMRVATGPGPSPRYGAAAATLGNTIVMFGGQDATTTNSPRMFAETWTWDGEKWTQHHVPGPSARLPNTMASYKGTVVLNGGWNGRKNLDDTWTWDGSKWTERKVPGPSARSAPAMTGF